MTDCDITRLAETAASAPDTAPDPGDLDLRAFGIDTRRDYLVLLAEWREGWHMRVAACRAAKRAMRLSGESHAATRSRAQARREQLRHELRALSQFRCRMKAAARQHRRLAA